SSLSVLFSLVNLLVFSIVLAVFNINIFVVFIIASLMYAVWVILFLKKRKVLDYKHFEVAAKEQSITIQLVQGMQEIKLNGAERSMRWTWERLQVKLLGLSMKGLSLNQWQQAGGFFINEGKNIFITFLSAKAVIDGQMTLGTMLAVQYIIGQLNSPIEQIIGFVQSWQNARISMDRLNEIHGMEDEEPADNYLHQELPINFQRKIVGGSGPIQAFPHEEDLSMPQGQLLEDSIFITRSLYDEDLLEKREVFHNADSISFDNLSFTYPGAGNEPVLHDISLHLPKGKTTAIVGVSGSGKTTLLKLLLRFYEPQKGEIKIGDVSLNSISHKVWRRNCGVVMQESFIFSDSISKNIAVGRENINMGKLRHAAEIANVREFIESLPLGYNTQIGAEGLGMSMGQKQRILIARSVYRDPDFIFFDEATNSLDANNEMQIIQNLESFFKGRTVIVVAHRLSTVKHAEQIILLNKGRISERGTHQELIILKGEYYRLVKNQLALGE
ncbi:MAG TPA: ATP-binding cassette domain-containing protein, partial [Parachlamydiaceae bacterium]|nr:ATP-binding cassette domain-containing protein [Parachlamydiaceae bacterium]